tara:strand:+ start:14 stop:436 length:423 start_codon:yes stop_codon:yes gene_type:complete
MTKEIEQVGGRVSKSPIFYKDNAVNRKLGRVGKIWKYKFTHMGPGKTLITSYKLPNNNLNKTKCKSPMKIRNKSGKCVTKKCSSNRKLSSKGICERKKCTKGKVMKYDKYGGHGRCVSKTKLKKKSPKKKSPKKKSTKKR